MRKWLGRCGGQRSGAPFSRDPDALDGYDFDVWTATLIVRRPRRRVPPLEWNCRNEEFLEFVDHTLSLRDSVFDAVDALAIAELTAVLGGPTARTI